MKVPKIIKQNPVVSFILVVLLGLFLYGIIGYAKEGFDVSDDTYVVVGIVKPMIYRGSDSFKLSGKFDVKTWIEANETMNIDATQQPIKWKFAGDPVWHDATKTHELGQPPFDFYILRQQENRGIFAIMKTTDYQAVLKEVKTYMPSITDVCNI